MNELVEWLRVQLDDDERVAKAAGGDHWPDSAHEMWDNTLVHARRHDPARVLRDVEAARERLAFIERLANYTDSPEDSVTTISMNALRTVAVNELLWAEVLPYVDRSDYRDEWRP